MDTQVTPGSDRSLSLGIVLLIVLYGLATAAGLTVAPHAQGTNTTVDTAEHGGSRSEQSAVAAVPHLLAVVPFVLLLGAIAVLPLMPATEHWWESNLHRFYVAGAWLWSR